MPPSLPVSVPAKQPPRPPIRPRALPPPPHTQIEIFDLGGSTSVRRIWKSYFSEVHAVLYVVDAADGARFEESMTALHDSLKLAHLADKPVVVYANKQDLPMAASAVEVATALALDALPGGRFNVLGCSARVAEGKQADPRVRDGLRWVVSQVNAVYAPLSARVAAESAVVKEEEARKKKEREELARKMKEERLRRQEAAEAAAAADAAAAEPASEPYVAARNAERGAPEAPNPAFGATNLPNQVESPGPKPPAPTDAVLPPGSPMGMRTFSDLRRTAGDAATAVPRGLPPVARQLLPNNDDASAHGPAAGTALPALAQPTWGDLRPEVPPVWGDLRPEAPSAQLPREAEGVAPAALHKNEFASTGASGWDHAAATAAGPSPAALLVPEPSRPREVRVTVSADDHNGASGDDGYGGGYGGSGDGSEPRGGDEWGMESTRDPSRPPPQSPGGVSSLTTPGSMLYPHANDALYACTDDGDDDDGATALPRGGLQLPAIATAATAIGGGAADDAGGTPSAKDGPETADGSPGPVLLHNKVRPVSSRNKEDGEKV
eukprot:357425-Chlamydomonas_euryale.AAC.5